MSKIIISLLFLSCVATLPSEDIELDMAVPESTEVPKTALVSQEAQGVGLDTVKESITPKSLSAKATGETAADKVVTASPVDLEFTQEEGALFDSFKEKFNDVDG